MVDFGRIKMKEMTVREMADAIDVLVKHYGIEAIKISIDSIFQIIEENKKEK